MEAGGSLFCEFKNICGIVKRVRSFSVAFFSVYDGDFFVLCCVYDCCLYFFALVMFEKGAEGYMFHTKFKRESVYIGYDAL